MVLSMTKKGLEERDSAGFGNDSEGSESGSAGGFSLAMTDEVKALDKAETFQKLERSPLEEFFVQQAIGLGKNSDAKWCDARGQQGPTPADFGDHKPIPVDSVCAAVVLSEEEE